MESHQPFEIKREPPSLTAGKVTNVKLTVTNLMPRECNDLVIKFNPPRELEMDRFSDDREKLSPGESWEILLQIETLPSAEHVLDLPWVLRWREGKRHDSTNRTINFSISRPLPPPDEPTKPSKSPEAIKSLRRQLAEAQKNLQLVLERKAQFVLEVDIPLQLIKEENGLRERIAELQKELEDC